MGTSLAPGVGAFITPPEAPDGVRVLVDDDALLVLWNPSSDDTVSLYEVSGVATKAGSATITCQSAGSWCRLSGGVEGTEYDITVRARNNQGLGSASTVVTATVPATLLPATDVVAKLRGDRLMATWQPPAGLAPSVELAYRVTITTADGKTPSDQQTCETAGTWCEFTGLMKGRRYVADVVAWANDDEADPIASSEVLVPESPEVVTNLRATPGDRSVEVAWDAPVDDGGAPIDRFVVSVVNGDGGCESSAMSCVVTGLRRGEPYEFEVSAVNDVGASPPVRVAVAPLPDVPGLVENLTLKNVSIPGDNRMQASWDAPAMSDESVALEYKAQIWPSGAACHSANRSCVFQGLRPMQAYRVKVTATNVVGEGPAEVTQQFAFGVPPGRPQRVGFGQLATGGFLHGEKVVVNWTGSEHGGGGEINQYIAVLRDRIPPDPSRPRGADLGTTQQTEQPTAICVRQATEHDEGWYSCEFDVDLKAGTYVEAQVIAESSNTHRSLSDVIQATIAGPPSAPRNGQVALVDGKVVVS